MAADTRFAASMDHENGFVEGTFAKFPRDKNGEICSPVQDRESGVGLFLEKGGRWQTLQIVVLCIAAVTSDMQALTIAFNGKCLLIHISF